MPRLWGRCAVTDFRHPCSEDFTVPRDLRCKPHVAKRSPECHLVCGKHGPVQDLLERVDGADCSEPVAGNENTLCSARHVHACPFVNLLWRNFGKRPRRRYSRAMDNFESMAAKIILPCDVHFLREPRGV